MKVGIVLSLLAVLAPTLTELIGIDERGGYFRQLHMYEAAVAAVANSGHTATLTAVAATKQQTFDVFMADVAYTLRVMLSHLREKFRSIEVAGLGKYPVELQPAFDILQKGFKSKKARLALNPFVHFRNDADSSDSDDGSQMTDNDDDAAVFVRTSYDPIARVAELRMSDG